MTICKICRKKPSVDNVEVCTEEECPYKESLAATEKAAKKSAKDRHSRAVEDPDFTDGL